VLPPEVTDAAIQARMTVPPEAVRQVERLVPDPGAKAMPVEKVSPEVPAPVFTLPDAIAFALRNSPRLRVARMAVARAEGAEEVAFAPFLPTLDYQSRLAYASAKMGAGAPGVLGSVEPDPTKDHAFGQAELTIQWTVYDFGRTAARFGQTVDREHVARLRVLRLEQTLAYDTTVAYLQVLRAEAARKVWEQAIRTSQAVLRDARNRLEGGVAERDNVLRARVQLSESREGLVAARQAEFDAVAQLNYVLGRNASLPLRLVDWKSRPKFALSLPECLQYAMTGRQEVAIAREEVAEAGHGLQAAKAECCPRIYARVGGGYVDGAGIVRGLYDGAGIHFDWRFYDGNRREGEKRVAKADVLTAAARAQSIFDGITLEVNLAYRAIAAAQQRIALAESTLTEARENLRLVRVKYQNGTVTPTDVVDAETTAIRSEQRFDTAIYDYLQALARLDYSTGAPPGHLLGAEAGPPAPEAKRDHPQELPPPRSLPPQEGQR
jgi:outer membrane protein TolC